MTDDERVRAFLIAQTNQGQLATHKRRLEGLEASAYIAEQENQHPEVADAIADYKNRIWVCEKMGETDEAGLYAELNRATSAWNFLALTLARIGAALDPDRLRGAKVKKAAKEGGNIRRGQTSGATQHKLQELARLIEKGQTVTSAAAALARKEGYGTESSLRKLWHRHRK
jgi:hypothetical protein